MISFFLGHVGLGDQILCNGLIRNIAQNNKTLFLPVKKHNLLNIKDMLKDLDNITYIKILDDEDMIKYYNLTKNIIDKTISIGIFGDKFLANNKSFDESFYQQACVDYNKRWDDFKYINNDYKQSVLLNDIKEQKYIFAHDDQSRNLIIKKNYLNNSIFLYRPKHNLGNLNQYTIFDYIKILEKAEEIHCMDSSFACMIDHFPQFYNKKKYIHRYIRKNSHNPYYKNNWEIIND